MLRDLTTDATVAAMAQANPENLRELPKRHALKRAVTCDNFEWASVVENPALWVKLGAAKRAVALIHICDSMHVLAVQSECARSTKNHGRISVLSPTTCFNRACFHMIQ